MSNDLTLADAVTNLKDEIISNWADRVNQSIRNAQKLRHPILINTLPAFIDALAKLLSKDEMLAGLEQSEGIAEEHGGERARLSTYEPSDLIQEYQIFRRTIFEILEKNDLKLSKNEWTAVNHLIDSSIRNSVASFELVHLQFREQFISTLTHDLRNPLGAADMAAELILDELGNPKEVMFLVAKIKENLKRVNQMIQNLLDTALVRGGERLKLRLSHTEILDIVESVVRELSLTHGRRFVIQGVSAKGFWDPEALTRALENLCSNAVKYGDTLKPITVKIELIHERLILNIHNWGPSIPVEEQETIFQVYRRAQAARSSLQKGWGLGLPLVRAVAEAHGGSVGITSREDVGTTFTFDIPQDARPFQESPVTTPQ